MRGNVALENRTVEVLRTDCNGNGLWFDADDRFWIDVNGDSRFDPLREKFACRTTCSIDGTQYAVAADYRGRSSGCSGSTAWERWFRRGSVLTRVLA